MRFENKNQVVKLVINRPNCYKPIVKYVEVVPESTEHKTKIAAELIWLNIYIKRDLGNIKTISNITYAKQKAKVKIESFILTEVELNQLSKEDNEEIIKTEQITNTK